MNWARHVISLEIRKILSYRAAFWIRFFASTLTEISVAYFLWKAIFEATGSVLMQGYSFHGLLFYYVFASLGSKIVMQSDQYVVSKEIYEGGLNRYLVYPVSFLGYQYVACVGKQIIAVVQFLLGFAVAVALFGLPIDQEITVGSILLGLFTAFLSGGLLFLLNTCLELVAFWQDVVWNLLAMLRFIGNLLGGLMIPIVFFPEWGQRLLHFTPFPVIYTFPIRCFLGQVTVEEWFTSLAILAAWSVAMILLNRWIWLKGTKQYAGVGV